MNPDGQDLQCRYGIIQFIKTAVRLGKFLLLLWMLFISSIPSDRSLRKPFHPPADHSFSFLSFSFSLFLSSSSSPSVPV
ncbi:hypothetical protein C7212DRAFT_339631 [Tuber magnatum]|uniref:Uncharacterized protein n=1 Tax=Tuber magnatum TaxID=42249 RepID=A0A317SB30_9PEZI|nr:hypothetical protein C7212DRAFT_339631 [Tuber magnatum]